MRTIFLFSSEGATANPAKFTKARVVRAAQGIVQPFAWIHPSPDAAPGLVIVQADPYLHPLITSAIIFVAVLLDSLRSHLVTCRRRKIRVEARLM